MMRAGRKVYDAGYCRMLSYAIDREADYKAENIHMDIHGVEYDLRYKEKEEQKTLHIAYPYPGRFNVYNTMAAAAAALVAGVSPDIIVSELGRKDRIVRGRFQTVHGPNQGGGGSGLFPCAGRTAECSGDYRGIPYA